MVDSIISVIGNLILPYLVLSLFVMLIVELFSQIVNLRAKNLEYCIRNMLADPGGKELANAVYGHPLIKSLSPGGYKPSYIPNRLFALALVDEIEKSAAADNFEGAVQLLANKNLQSGLRALFRQTHSGQEVSVVQDWFREVMNQASGRYRRLTFVILAFVAVVLVLMLNLDAIVISNYTAQRSVNEKVLEDLAEHQITHPADSGDFLRSRAALLDFPIGWSHSPLEFGSMQEFSLKISGFAASALAVMLGAPFLFDILNKFMVVRFSMKQSDISSGDVEGPGAK